MQKTHPGLASIIADQVRCSRQLRHLIPKIPEIVITAPSIRSEMTYEASGLEETALLLARHFNAEFIPRIFYKNKIQQHKLSHVNRMHSNLAITILHSQQKLTKKKILILDDMVTTGTTLRQAKVAINQLSPPVQSISAMALFGTNEQQI